MAPAPHPGPADAELLAQRAFLRRLARGILGDDDAAEDVVQEVELRALRHGFLGVRAWLVTITRRLALNARRARERRALHEEAAARPQALPGPAEALAGIDLQRAVLEAVRHLDEPYRSTVWQRYYEDRSPNQIAARTGVPVPTVKTRLRRALEQLRRALDEERAGGRESWTRALLALAGPRLPWSAVVPTAGGMLLMKKLAIAVLVVTVAWFGWKVQAPGRGTLAETDAATVERPAGSAPESPALAQPSAREAPARLVASTAAAVQESADLVSETATLGVHASWEQDASAATGIGLTLWPEDDLLADLHALRAETDGDGRARLEGIAPGRYTLHSDRGTHTALELAAREERALELALPPGLDVVGEVVDGSLNPVPGAEVWLEGQCTGSLAGRTVTRAGADGTFRLRALSSEQSLGAFAPGHGPSALVRLRTRQPVAGEDIVRVTVVLDRAGRELHGRVVDPEGRPVEGARVALGTRGNAVRGDDWRPRARVLVTDAEGAFRAWIDAADGWTGPCPVHVLAEGFALTRVPDEDVRQAVGSTLVVHLAAGAYVEGRLLDEQGQPVGDGRVSLDAAGDLSPSAVPFPLPEARSAADGAWALAHVPAGELRLVAWLEQEPTRRAARTGTVSDGEHARWDLTLGTAAAIHGHVVDEQGVALAGRSVLASSERSITGVVSDAQGSFVFVPPDEETEWTLGLLGTSGVVDEREHVRLGDEITLVAHDRTASIRGGFSDRAELARAGESVRACLTADAGMRMPNEAELDPQGAFAFEGVPPARYRVEILCGEDVLCHGPWFDLADGQALELDWLETRVPAGIAVSCTLPPGVTLADVRAALDELDGDQGTPLQLRGDELRTDGVQPGRYRLSVRGPGLALHQENVELRADETLYMTCSLRAGVARDFVFVPPDGATVTNLRVSVREPATGHEWVQDLRSAFVARPFTARFGLAPGSYAFEALARDGLAARGTLEVGTEPAEAELRFALR